MIPSENWSQNNWNNWTTGFSQSTGLAIGDRPSATNINSLSNQTHIDIATFSSSFEGRTGGYNVWSTSTNGGAIQFGALLNANNFFCAYIPNFTNATLTLTNNIILSSLPNPAWVYLSLPLTPAQLTLNTSSIQFFNGTSSVTLLFSTYIQSGDGINQYLKIPYSAISSLGGTITSVVITLNASAIVSVYLGGLRLVSTNWVVSNLDFDTVNQNLCRPFPLTNYTFPGSSGTGRANYVQPSYQTIGNLWLGANSPSDPMPIDVTFAAYFNTGGSANTLQSPNTITLLARGTNASPVLESQINGTPYSNLNGLQLPSTSQGSSINASYISCSLTWLPAQNSSYLNQFQVQITNSANNTLYTFDSFNFNGITNINSSGVYMQTGLQLLTDHYFVFSVSGETAQAWIYTTYAPSNPYGYPQQIVFNSGAIKDVTTFYRQPGRIGINANLQDGNAVVHSVRPWKSIYGQFKSNLFKSITPVQGAQLYSVSTPPVQLFGQQGVVNWTGHTDGSNRPASVSIDTNRTLSGQATLASFPSGALRGGAVLPSISTQTLTPYGDAISGISDFSNLQISMAIFPNLAANTAADGSATPLFACLLQSGPRYQLTSVDNATAYGINITVPQLIPNQWNYITLSIPTAPQIQWYVTLSSDSINKFGPYPVTIIPSELYSLRLIYNGLPGGQLWIDNVQIAQNSVAWYAKATPSNYYESDAVPWVPFGNTVNNNNQGIKFDQPRQSIQVRADMLNPSASIYNGYTLVPKYATLGKPVANIFTPNVLTFTSVIATPGGGTTYSFSTTTSGISPINYIWNFGDGTYGTGPTPTHTYTTTYPNVNTYTVNVTGWDQYGNLTIGYVVI